jgi:hypothetical protein
LKVREEGGEPDPHIGVLKAVLIGVITLKALGAGG